jgi:hypothetical protein
VNKLTLYILVLFITVTIHSEDSKKETEAVYQAVLKATFVNDKVAVAKKLLTLNECKEGLYTKKLLKDSHYWNREAGVFLVGECRNRNLDQEVCKMFIEDHMIRTPIQTLIMKEPNRYSKDLISIYKKDLWGPTKEDLFSLYKLTGDEDTSVFLQNIIQDKLSPDRTIAFKALMKHTRKPGDLYFRSFLKDKELKKYSLQWILETGSSKDSDLFRTILSDANSDVEELALACMAIQKWGDEKEKKTTYLRFLKEDNQSLLPAVFSVFNGLLDEDIFTEVSRLSRTGKTQIIRTEAVLQLKNFSDSRRLSFIILFLQEDYQTQAQPHIGDAIATVITFGIHGIFQGLQEKSRKAKFESVKSELIAYLQKETGEKFTTFSEWKAWANKKKLLPITITYE